MKKLQLWRLFSFVYFAGKQTVLAYENKLPVFNEMLTKYPHNTRFKKLIADAPTTTLQRLKGITTGSLPTFIDVGSNFATAEINEDNIIDQVCSAFARENHHNFDFQ